MKGNMILIIVPAALVVLLAVLIFRKRTAYLEPVKRELKKEKQWLRRGEYNAAMVKGRQNLELLLKLVAEKNGIQLDNTAKAQANAREMEERENQGGRGKYEGTGRRRKSLSVMTHHQFNGWMTENGYLDRVARWEMNQVRIIGNKAVHENYSDKEDAWNQYNYLEDILKTVTEKSQKPGKRPERKRDGGRDGRDNTQKKKSAQKGNQDGTGKQKTVVEKEKKEQAAKKEKPVKKEQAAKKEKPVKKEQAAKKEQPAQTVAENTGSEQPKKRRRRRRPAKKPSEGNGQVVHETESAAVTEVTRPQEKKHPQEKKQSQESTAESAKEQTAGSSSSAKRRRRRRRHPAAQKTEGVSGNTLSEGRNENA